MVSEEEHPEVGSTNKALIVDALDSDVAESTPREAWIPGECKSKFKTKSVDMFSLDIVFHSMVSFVSFQVK